MIFSSPAFLFIFLPALLFCYFCFKTHLACKNLILLVFSLLFYSYGEKQFIIIILSSIVANHFLGKIIYLLKNKKTQARVVLILAVIFNLLPLVYFKYSGFILDNLNLLFKDSLLSFLLPSHLPLGVSFFTFQAISYLIDIYRGSVKEVKNIFHTALFIALFPQLIAGPIIRYKQIYKQFDCRFHSLDKFAGGCFRFIIGLAKKVLLADALGEFSDFAFNQDETTLTTGLAWLGALSFTLQVYFDFAAYSDMAIGLGAMFGFKIPENFKYPYISRSVREFWQRWHISLTTWFRDYLYASLRALPRGRAFKNLNTFLVFLLVGIWHGANWNFALWGAYYACFLILERKGLAKILSKLPRICQHVYLIIITLISAVLFRSESLAQIGLFLKSMAGFNLSASAGGLYYLHLNTELFILLGLSVLFSTPVFPAAVNYLNTVKESAENASLQKIKFSVVSCCSFFFWGILFLYTLGTVAENSETPFVYFRF